MSGSVPVLRCKGWKPILLRASHGRWWIPMHGMSLGLGMRSLHLLHCLLGLEAAFFMRMDRPVLCLVGVSFPLWFPIHLRSLFHTLWGPCLLPSPRRGGVGRWVLRGRQGIGPSTPPSFLFDLNRIFDTWSPSWFDEGTRHQDQSGTRPPYEHRADTCTSVATSRKRSDPHPNVVLGWTYRYTSKIRGWRWSP